jgi:ABC-type amino acid transport substrate-binding protein
MGYNNLCTNYMILRHVKLVLILCLIIAVSCIGYQYKNELVLLLQKNTTHKNLTIEENYSPPNYLSDSMVTFEHTRNTQADKGKILGDIKDILRRGELIVCAKKDDHNLFFQMKMEDGKYVGKDIDFTKQIAAALGVKLTYRMIYDTHDKVVEAISRGEGDIGVADLSYTQERSRKVLYSIPYVVPKKMLLVDRVFLEKKDEKTLTKLLNNNDTIICTAANTSYETFIKQMFPKANVLSKENWEETITETIRNREISATIRDDIRIKFLIKKHPDLLIMAMPIIINHEEDQIAAVVNFKSVQLLLWLNKFIETEAKIESADSILKKYEGYVK